MKKDIKFDLDKLIQSIKSLDNNNPWVKAFSHITNVMIIFVIVFTLVVSYKSLGTPPDEGYSPLERRLMHNKIRLMNETKVRRAYENRWLPEDDVSEDRSYSDSDIYTPKYQD